MSDVEAGGATVFPNAGAQVLPEKVRQLFWVSSLGRHCVVAHLLKQHKTHCKTQATNYKSSW